MRKSILAGYQQPESILANMPKTDFADTGCHIQTGIALYAQRLQGDRFVKASQQDIGTRTDTDGRAGGGADIIAVQRAVPNIRRWRNHVPNQDAAFRVPDVHAELGY